MGIVIRGITESPDDVVDDLSWIGDIIIPSKAEISDHEKDLFDQYSSSIVFSSLILGADEMPLRVIFFIQSLRIYTKYCWRLTLAAWTSGMSVLSSAMLSSNVYNFLCVR
jgi:hypothetical protein